MREILKRMPQNFNSDNSSSVMFIPDLRILEYFSPEDCLNFFRSTWKRDPKAVCLPLISTDGISVDNLYFGNRSIKVNNGHGGFEERAFGQIVRQFSDLGPNFDIILYVNPSLEFLGIPACQKVDIRNQGSPSACCNKKITKDYIKYFVADGIEKTLPFMEGKRESLKGVAIDITDLWGMGANEGKIHPTCFCIECRQYFSDKGLDISSFETFPSPWNLALKESGASGLSYIDNFKLNELAASVVGKSSLRGFDKAFSSENEKINAATLLMRYMKFRHEMVEDFLMEAFSEAYYDYEEEKPVNLKKIVITEGSQYDWTSGIFLESLSEKVFDELWFDYSQNTPKTKSSHKAFMWRRSTYALNTFFEFLSNIADQRILTTTALGYNTEEQLSLMLKSSGQKALQTNLNGLIHLHALENDSESKRNGFVGVVFNSQILSRLIRNPNISPLQESVDNDYMRGQILTSLIASGKLNKKPNDKDTKKD